MRHTIVVVGAVIMLGGCTANQQVFLPLPGSIAVQHLFVANDGFPPTLSIYALPVSNSSASVGTLTGAAFDGLCVDQQGRLFVPDRSVGQVKVYTPPVTNGASPAFSITVAASDLTDCAFDASGNLYLASDDPSIAVIKAPVGPASTVTSHITTDLTRADRVNVDASGDVFVNDEISNSGPTFDQIIEYAPLSAGNTELAKFGQTNHCCNEGVAVGPDGNLYVPDRTTTGHIDVFKPPFTNSSAVDHSITVSIANLDRIQFGPDANLYVSSPGDGKVYVFAPPYTGTAIVALPTAATSLAGLAFGP